jgi:Tol biopolymer transport system component
MRKYASILGLIAAVLLLGGTGPVLKAPGAEATFPGSNGRIVYVFDDGTGSDLWTMLPDGTDKKPVHTGITNLGDPRWSADGNKIAFWSVGTTNQIHIIDADGQNIQTLPVEGDFPSWSPDGKKIAYYST